MQSFLQLEQSAVIINLYRLQYFFEALEKYQL
jgi:hypothetical protein